MKMGLYIVFAVLASVVVAACTTFVLTVTETNSGTVLSITKEPCNEKYCVVAATEKSPAMFLVFDEEFSEKTPCYDVSDCYEQLDLSDNVRELREEPYLSCDYDYSRPARI